MDAGLWTMGAYLRTPDAGLWILDTVVDWFRIESELAEQQLEI